MTKYRYMNTAIVKVPLNNMYMYVIILFTRSRYLTYFHIPAFIVIIYYTCSNEVVEDISWGRVVRAIEKLATGHLLVSLLE